MAGRRREIRKVMTQIEKTRRLMWRRIQRADSAGLIYEPLGGGLYVKPPGWKMRRRCDIRRAFRRSLAAESPTPVPDLQTTEG